MDTRSESLKGNQNAKGHGRPPKEGFSNEEVTAIGERLLNWMKDCEERQYYPVHMSEFYSRVEAIDPKYWRDSLSKRDCFSPYYEKFRCWMVSQIMKNKDLPTGYGSRYLGLYDSELRLHEKEIAKEKAFEIAFAKVEADIQKTIPQNDKVLSDLLNALREIGQSQENEMKGTFKRNSTE